MEGVGSSKTQFLSREDASAAKHSSEAKQVCKSLLLALQAVILTSRVNGYLVMHELMKNIAAEAGHVHIESDLFVHPSSFSLPSPPLPPAKIGEDIEEYIGTGPCIVLCIHAFSVLGRAWSTSLEPPEGGPPK